MTYDKGRVAKRANFLMSKCDNFKNHLKFNINFKSNITFGEILLFASSFGLNLFGLEGVKKKKKKKKQF